jgi:Zn-dependent metalloprotease
MPASRSLVAATILAATASLTVATLSSAAADDQKKPSSTATDLAPKPSRDAVAEEAASEVIAARPSQLYLSRYDKVQAQSTQRSGKLRFVSYERTYRGLPVIGGDFVVVVDGKGNVVYTSVAQTAKVQLADVRASLPATAARTRTSGKVANARLGRSTLVVLQRGSRSSLAWRTTATGRRAGKPSRLDVYVDADSGAVLKTQEHILYGDGNAKWSGPTPVHIDTKHSGATYSMTTPGVTTLTCQDAATNTTFTGPDDIWGNGTGTVRETGCVDALYAAQQEHAMLAAWLDRDGMTGTGEWLPIRVGLNDENAFYDGTQVQVGHNTAGEWIGALDIVGHEFGHGIDDHTPGGLSGGNTQEFVADTFGASTEWFDNQPAPFDTRDFLVGEEVNLVGSGAIRDMAEPANVGDPNCYSAAIDTDPPTEVHAAAGPGDHWFYLAAMGTNPSGFPVSPTCNSTTFSGIGVQKAMKVMYTAMLMKTSASSYQNYRLWTLLAAKFLYGQSSCTEFNRVKFAWKAVSVPSQPGEGGCTVGQPSVAIGNATHHTFTAGTTIPPFTLTATGGASPYTWSANGLPPGLSLNGATGQVSGSLGLDTAGSYTAQVTATDNLGRVGRSWFTVAVDGSSSNACSGQRLGNKGFENKQRAPWVTQLWSLNRNPAYANSGTNHIWLNGYGQTATETLSQTVAIPAGCKAKLTFYVWSNTKESPTEAFDVLTVRLGKNTIYTQSNIDAIQVPNCPCTKAYVRRTVLLPPEALGKTSVLSFTGVEDSALFTNWHIDDVTLTISAP